MRCHGDLQNSSMKERSIRVVSALVDFHEIVDTCIVRWETVDDIHWGKYVLFACCKRLILQLFEIGYHALMPHVLAVVYVEPRYLLR